MPELLRHLGKEVCGECETRIWYAGGKRRPLRPPDFNVDKKKRGLGGAIN